MAIERGADRHKNFFAHSNYSVKSFKENPQKILQNQKKSLRIEEIPWKTEKKY